LPCAIDNVGSSPAVFEKRVGLGELPYFEGLEDDQMKGSFVEEDIHTIFGS
jgi:hypothetical protein